jgi:hypothetical protein
VAIVAAKLLSTFTVNGLFRHPNHAAEITYTLKAVNRLMRSPHSFGADVMLNLCYAMANLTEREQQEIISEVCTFRDVVAKLVSLLGNAACATDIQMYALDALGHLAAGDEECVGILINELGLMTPLSKLLTSRNTTILASACRCVSNICGGSDTIIQHVMDAGLFPVLMRLMGNPNANADVRFYASYAVMFSTHGANLLQTQQLVEDGIVPLLCHLLQNGEGREQTLEALKSLDMLLYKFDFRCDFDHVNDLVNAQRGWGRIALLRLSEDEEIRQLAMEMSEQVIADSYTE